MEHFVCVAFKGVQSFVRISEVEEGNSLERTDDIRLDFEGVKRGS